jgi:5'-nucleotidase
LSRSLRLLLTNDDGIDAPGLEALRNAVATLGSIFVVAPASPMSGCGHAITTHGPIAIERRGGDRVAILGSPADCVRLALAGLERNPDWVVSGINAGGNLGVDVYHSGTVAAAREAAIRGVRATAISQYIRKGFPLDWDRAARLAHRVIAELFEEPLEPLSFWNVNLPYLAPDEPDPQWVFCPVDPSPLPLDYLWTDAQATYSGVYAERPRRPGADVAVCFSGRITVSRVTVG